MEEPIEQIPGKKAVALNIKISVDKGKDKCTGSRSKEKKGPSEQTAKCQKSGTKSKKACCTIGNFMPPPQPPRSQMLPCGCLVIYDDPCFSPNSSQPKSANKCNAGVQCCDTKRGLERCAQGKKHGVCTSSGCQTSDQYHCIKKRGKQTCSTASSGCQTMATCIPKTKEQMELKQHGHPTQPPQNRSVQAFFSTRDLQTSRPQMHTRSVQYVPPSSMDVPTETLYKSKAELQVDVNSTKPPHSPGEQVGGIEKTPVQAETEQSAMVQEKQEVIPENQEMAQETSKTVEENQRMVPETSEQVEAEENSETVEENQRTVQENSEDVVETLEATEETLGTNKTTPIANVKKPQAKENMTKTVKPSPTPTQGTEMKANKNSDKIVPTHKFDSAALQREKSKQVLPPLTKKIQNNPMIEEISDSGSGRDEELQYDDAEEEDNEFEDNDYGEVDEEACDCEDGEECCSADIEYERRSSNGSGNGWMDGGDLWGWDTWDKLVSLINGEPIPNPCFQNCDCDESYENNSAEYTDTEGTCQGGVRCDGGDFSLCTETTSEDTYILLIALPLVFLSLMASLKGC